MVLSLYFQFEVLILTVILFLKLVLNYCTIIRRLFRIFAIIVLDFWYTSKFWFLKTQMCIIFITLLVIQGSFEKWLCDFLSQDQLCWRSVISYSQNWTISRRIDIGLFFFLTLLNGTFYHQRSSIWTFAFISSSINADINHRYSFYLLVQHLCWKLLDIFIFAQDVV